MSISALCCKIYSQSYLRLQISNNKFHIAFLEVNFTTKIKQERDSAIVNAIYRKSPYIFSQRKSNLAFNLVRNGGHSKLKCLVNMLLLWEATALGNFQFNVVPGTACQF